MNVPSSIIATSLGGLEGRQPFVFLQRLSIQASGSFTLFCERDIETAEERRRPSIVVHSSGSRGLPMPLRVVHARYDGESRFHKVTPEGSLCPND